MQDEADHKKLHNMHAKHWGFFLMNLKGYLEPGMDLRQEKLTKSSLDSSFPYHAIPAPSSAKQEKSIPQTNDFLRDALFTKLNLLSQSVRRRIHKPEFMSLA